MARALIGTSGWIYKHWHGVFYPPDINEHDYLPFYANDFDSVELNYSFYKLPTPQNYFEWRQQVPDDFVFAVKGSRYLTHMKKLKDPEEPWQNICATAGCLNEKLGVVRLQFPARWHLNLQRLGEFLACTEGSTTEEGQAKIRIAFEFREESWFCPSVYKLLER